MSTPIFQEVKSAPANEDDLQQRMQRMIDLQNTEMKLSQHYKDDGQNFNQSASSSRGDPPETTTTASVISSEREDDARSLSLGSKRMSRSVGLSSLHNLHDHDAGGDDHSPPPPPSKNSDRSSAANSEMFSPPQDQDVGKGTLYFNSEKLGSAATAVTQSVNNGTTLSSSEREDRRLITAFPENQFIDTGEVASTATYGSVDQNAPPVPPPPPPPPPPQSSALPENPHFGSPYQQAGGSHPMHDNFARHEAYENYQNYDYTRQQRQHLRHSSTVSSFLKILKMCGKCLRHVLLMCFCCCSTDAIEEEQLHRSFCYGAIDGMLTGSGIVAAFCGMDVLAPTSNIAVRSFVVAFSAAACFADSLCMALGHVWTTHVLVSASAKERSEQRLAVDNNRADAKGKLVDMLLERGMLKIDAMSLVDTLEGYPDFFVSALVGDALVAGGVGKAIAKETSSPDMASRSGGGGGSAENFAGSPAWNTGGALSHQLADQEAGDNRSVSLWKFPSYSQRMSELEQEVDPDAAFVSAAMTESRREGLFMTLGFSLFAVLPSLIYLTIPMMITLDHHTMSSLYAGMASTTLGIKEAMDEERSADGISASSIMITTAAVIMWCLGVWKSTFMDSNWMLFGIETVVVLLICVGAAYGVGALFAICIPDLDASILNNSGGTTSEKSSL